ncbi:ParB N-terminal domain-containing protein [Nocardia otitidiscaviarum]|uniref:ParB N-terminal domain-containing protein n=1 Tax=Nocardia otitidiscaviarum TaxID=1823 RepID=UPI001896326C|nr:ParB N-terminal domain-containing protein [Nocardia otitidiscaviarum]MBF6183328.1 ParB N-terminal domain-containing protein [Nocardia otitidiscaviarum]
MTNHNLAQDRAAFLDSRQRTKSVTVPAWPRDENDLPLVQLPVDWPMFSTLNHRTRAEQLAEISAAGRPDLFTRDPLGPEAQAAQYRILHSQAGFDQLKEDLQERGQQEPAIITADGVLINGNRRTAALRSLYLEDGVLDAQYVRCLVLPKDATPEELVDLETELQVAKDFKQDYSWVNEALLIEEHYDRAGKNWDRVAARMHRAVSDVRGMYEKLQQLHQLVELSNGARVHLDFVDNESVFDELAKHVKNKSPQEADAVRAVYFLGVLAGTKYRDLRHLRITNAATRVRSEIEGDSALKPILDAAEVAAAGARQDDPLSDLLGDMEPPSPLHNLLSFIATKRPESTVPLATGEQLLVQDALNSISSSIAAAADEAKEEKRDKASLQAPLDRADKAVAELERVLDSLPKARASEGWNEVALAEKLMSIRQLVKRIELIQ